MSTWDVTEAKAKRRGRPPGTSPPPVFTATFRFVVTPEMKEYILNCGGAAFLRSLVAREQAATRPKADTNVHRQRMANPES